MDNEELGQVIYIVPKTELNAEHKLTDKKKWAVILPPPIKRGSKIEWRILDARPHELEINPPSTVIPGSLVINGNHATADVYAGAPSGYYEYFVFVDGEFAEGGSAPGIIIG